MPDRAEQGRKAALTTKERFGEDAFKKWGADGNKKRLNPKPLFKDKEAATKAGAVGGKRGKRHRLITLSTKLTAGEWGILLKLSNRAVGELRLKGETNAVDQHNVYFRIMELWGEDKWYEAITKVFPHPRYLPTLAKVITEECEHYDKLVEGQPRHSYDREYYSELRNVRAAFILAQQTYAKATKSD